LSLLVDNIVSTPYGEYKMKTPSALSTWFMVLFFLFVGLAAFIPAFNDSFFAIFTGIFALGAAVTLFLGK